ncbi:hypothetical protein [Streptomyces sp. NPDC006631]|uniref:hypothetical protein n=1 Tax=Streptomyces sp. NPDC006631 TaxID=3364752 RepID=UPI0036BDAA79
MVLGLLGGLFAIRASVAGDVVLPVVALVPLLIERLEDALETQVESVMPERVRSLR